MMINTTFANTTTTSPTTTPQPQPDVFNDELKFIIVPLIAVIIIMLLSALVYLMAKRQRLNIIRNNLMSLYDFDTNEQEWESLNSYDNPNYTGFATTIV